MKEKNPNHHHDQAYLPLAKRHKDEVIIEPVLDELVIYDLERKKFHALNETAAEIWRLCDGNRSVPEIARQLQSASDLPSSQAEEVVWLGLARLRRAKLLEEIPARRQSKPVNDNRRRMLQAAGGLLALPIVSSVLAPFPGQASSLCPCCNPARPCYTPGGGCSAANSSGSCGKAINCFGTGQCP